MAGRERREKIHHGETWIYTEKILARITKTRSTRRRTIDLKIGESLKSFMGTPKVQK